MTWKNKTPSSNGNGHAPSKRLPEPNPLEELIRKEEPPPWLKAMRAALESSVKPEDLTDIMQTQVTAAKKGSAKSAKFVMDQVQKLMQTSTAPAKPVSIVQNNYYDTPDDLKPETSTDAPPRSPERIEKMRRRHSAGLPLINERDRPTEGPAPMSDEEEKAFRRQLEEESEDR